MEVSGRGIVRYSERGNSLIRSDKTDSVVVKTLKKQISCSAFAARCLLGIKNKNCPLNRLTA